MQTFEDLQRQLDAAWALNKPGGAADHVVVALPSFSVAESLLEHYSARIPAMEHRFLLAQLMLYRIPGCEMIFLSSEAPSEEVLAYYRSLIPGEHRASVVARFRSVVVPDHSHRSIAAKLLDRPDIIAGLRASFAGRPVFIEPWNVTEHEVEVALRLGAPVNGTAPALWPLGYKSAGRRMFRAAGVPVPCGREDVRGIADAVAAIGAISAERPEAAGVVIKHDDSGAGDGNVVIRFRDVRPEPEALTAHIAALPDWYLHDLAAGGIVEELISGERFSSPSAQVDISPRGAVEVLATHEQILTGDAGQVYAGCRFPADPAYSARLADHARAIGETLARKGVIGRFSVDFAAAWTPAAGWTLHALEVNLRKGGTTHPYSTLRHLVPGRYDPQAGEWHAADGTRRAYTSTDNFEVAHEGELSPKRVIDAIREAGLQFDHRRGSGVVLHMLARLAIDGRFGVTAIGHSPAEAAELAEAVARLEFDAEGRRASR